jgi:hypothetical protein
MVLDRREKRLSYAHVVTGYFELFLQLHVRVRVSTLCSRFVRSVRHWHLQAIAWGECVH